MLGNDVVDLTVDVEKHLNKRFVNRVLSNIEQQQLNNSTDKNTMLWSLWAIKEACYKACQKIDHQLLFSPPQFVLTHPCLKRLTEHNYQYPFNGILKHKKITLQVRLLWQSEKPLSKDVYPSVVHATAIISKDPDASANIQVEMRKMKQHVNYSNQSSEVRIIAKRMLLNNGISAMIDRPPLKINDYIKPGPPILIAEDKSVLPHEISLSHDNDWLAVALLIE